MAKKESLREKNQDEVDNKPLIYRGKLDSITVYEITDYELEMLDRGSPDSDILNYSILLLSAATSFLIALLTTEIKSIELLCAFEMCVIVGYVIGLFLFHKWYKDSGGSKPLINKIKDRVPQNSETNE